MVKFILTLWFADDMTTKLPVEERKAIVDTCIKKVMKMPVIPRVGEFVMLGGDIIKVKKVYHDLLEQSVEVECDVSLLEGVGNFETNQEGWNLDELRPAGRELFLRKLKEIEEGLL